MYEYRIRTATPDDLGEARAVVPDTVHRDFGTGYMPRWHADIIDPERFYLAPPRHTLLMAVGEQDGTVAATTALDARAPRTRRTHAGSRSAFPRARPHSSDGCAYAPSTGGGA